MKINVLNKKKFVEVLSSQQINDSNVENYNQIYISINNSNSTNHYFKKDYDNVLNLFFDDVTQDYEKNEKTECEGYNFTNFIANRDLKAFSDKDAIAIIEFLKKQINSPSLIVHCSAGISRSGAVGLFINDYLRQDYFEFIKINPQVKPNQLVLKILKQYGN